MLRSEMHDKIIANKTEIERLKNENSELAKQNMLLCDEQQWYVEKEENITVTRRPLMLEKKLIGRIYWKEDFKDEGTGEVITIERQEVVRVNGEWL